MKLEIARGGGLAGIPTTTHLQSASLPAEDAKKLEAEVRSAGLLSAPASAPAAAPAHADDLLYEVTVKDGENEHSHRFSDASMPEGVRSLIEWVDSRPERDFKPGP